MYYSEDLIQEVQSKNNILDVVGSYVHLQRKGGNYFGLCPFHNEKTGSFSVSPGRGIYHCFGCGKGGNVITFVMEYENYSFQEAMEMLADRAGIQLPKQEYTKEMKAAKDQRTRLLEMHKDAALFYVSMLRSDEGKIGRDYFAKRKITDETIRAFGLGYTGRYSDGLYKYLKSKGYKDTELKDAGLVTIGEKGAHDKFWNRVMFPIMDPNNHVIAFGGRVLGTGEPKYLNSQETRIFDKSRNLYGLNVARRQKEGYILLCEGYVDVISLHQAGFKNAVASLGTAFTTQHGSILKRYTDEVILCYDNDGAGRKAILRAYPMLREAGLNVKVINLEPYKDPDEFIVNLGADEFRKRAKESMNAFLFSVHCARDEYDFSDPQDKANFFNETAKKIAAFENSIERDSYTEAVAKAYGIDYQLLKSQVSKIGNEIGLAKKPDDAYQAKAQTLGVKKKNSGVEEAERLVLTFLVDAPEYFEKIEKVLKPEDFSGELFQDVAQKIFDGCRNKNLNAQQIISEYISTDRYNEVAALLSSVYTENRDEKEKLRATSEAILKIKNESLDQRIAASTDPAALMELMKEKKNICNYQDVLK